MAKNPFTFQSLIFGVPFFEKIDFNGVQRMELKNCKTNTQFPDNNEKRII